MRENFDARVPDCAKLRGRVPKLKATGHYEEIPGEKERLLHKNKYASIRVKFVRAVGASARQRVQCFNKITQTFELLTMPVTRATAPVVALLKVVFASAYKKLYGVFRSS